MTIIRYIGTAFTFGLTNCVHYNQDFVILRFAILRFFSIHFTVILSRLKDIVLYSKWSTSLHRGLLNEGPTV